MWLGSRTYLLIFVLFQLKNLETDATKKRIRKTKEEILKKVKESIMIDEIANEDIKKQQKVLKAQRKQQKQLITQKNY